MALKFTIPFPISAPPPSTTPNPNPNPSGNRPPTEVRFARWNNAHMEKFNQRKRAQQEIEDDIRRHRRFDSATKIAQIDDSATTAATNDVVFKSTGTPSSPSRPSIPGKKSKYSKPPDHPAFRKVSKPIKITSSPVEKPVNPKAKLNISEDGVSYVIDGAPFEFQYSYTETPKVKPIKLREAPYAPFGPSTMGRPWTGRAPLPASKKKLKEFDSFELPPPDKKGVKPVQKPGPFLPGTGPKYVYKREEILGEPLSKEEITQLVNGSMKSDRQLNMGRDGLTHNMLDNIHAHWKRRRVCKIKCKGVCTVDMENVCEQLEEKTGGKIIYRRGGVLYLFRGRNYNYKTRPRYPLMLWKPVTPLYPRLIQHAPEGLTVEEATDMRKRGRKLIPICKLGKNGVYCDLVKNVREAFQECELVRINCQGMKGSDYRKIGAKLKDLVPCVLVSFEREHILMWRGRDGKPSLPKPENDSEEAKESVLDGALSEGDELASSSTNMLSVKDASPETLDTSISSVGSEDVHAEPRENSSYEDDDKPLTATGARSTTVRETNETKSDAMMSIYGNVARLDDSGFADDELESVSNSYGSETENDDEVDEEPAATSVGSETELDNDDEVDEEPAATSVGSETMLGSVESTGNQTESSEMDSLNHDKLQKIPEVSQDQNGPARSNGPAMKRVLHLLEKAVESGGALVLDDATLDADSIYKISVSFAKSAPPGPVFRHRSRKVAVQKSEKNETGDSLLKRETTDILSKEETGDVLSKRETGIFLSRKENGEFELKKEVATVSQKKGNVRSTCKRKKDLDELSLDVLQQGSLRVDELAKLLA